MPPWVLYVLMSVAMAIAIVSISLSTVAFLNNHDSSVTLVNATSSVEVDSDMQLVQNVSTKGNLTSNSLVVDSATVGGKSTIATLITNSLLVNNQAVDPSSLTRFANLSSYIVCSMGQGTVLSVSMPSTSAGVVMIPMDQMLATGGIYFVAGDPKLFGVTMNSSTNNATFVNLTPGLWSISVTGTLQGSGVDNVANPVYCILYGTDATLAPLPRNNSFTVTASVMLMALTMLDNTSTIYSPNFALSNTVRLPLTTTVSAQKIGLAFSITVPSGISNPYTMTLSNVQMACVQLNI